MVEFEVLEPATVNFPDEVGQLLILNRAPVSLNVINEENRGNMEVEHMMMIDTLVCNNTFRGLLKVLEQSPINRFHVPFWLSERRSDTTALRDLILTKREVAALCNEYGTDAIISLEYYSFGIDVRYDFYSGSLEGIVQSQYYPVSNKLIWNIYLPGKPKPFNTYITVDTLYFSQIVDGELQDIPDQKEMIAELFYRSGMKYGAYLVPVWNKTSRLLYKGKGDSLRLASKLTDQGNWDRAYEIWEGLAASEDSAMACKALNNMAIYYELEDNLDSANLLLDRALSYDTLEVVRFYKEDLDIRILNREEVLRQLR